MVKRNISKQRYLVAGIITFLIFSLGIVLGMVLDYERIQFLEQEGLKQELDYKSLQLQFSFLNSKSVNNGSCAAFQKATEASVAELSDSLEAVQTYRGFSSNKEDFDLLERRYILDNLRYWLLVRESQIICPTNRLTILYFFSEDDCPNCPDQGVILTYFKKKFGDDLLVFPINIDRVGDEAMIAVVLSQFGIDSYPSLVVDDFVQKGSIGKKDLGLLICDKLGVGVDKCK